MTETIELNLKKGKIKRIEWNCMIYFETDCVLVAVQNHG